MFNEYKQHRDRWVSWCSTDEQSISAQFSSMLWSDAAYRLVNETRRSSTKEFATFSGVLGEMFDFGWVASQAIAIRKLVDRDGRTISLCRLAKDIERHRPLITREAYVCHDGSPYDYEAVEQGAMTERLNGVPVTVDQRAALVAKHAHLIFDELSGVLRVQDRKPDDAVLADIFPALDKAIEDCGARPVVDLVNRYLFHASDAAERSRVGREFILVLGNVTSLHEKLAALANFISRKLVGDGPCVTGVGTAQFDVLHLWDQPFANDDDFEALRNWWHEHSASSDKLGYSDLKLP